MFEITYDYFIASRSHQVKIRNMEVDADFESRLHKAVSFVAERNKEFWVWREQKMLKALPSFSVGSCQEEAKEKKAMSRGCRGEVSGESDKK